MAYLGANSKYQQIVRDDVLLNKSADPVAREAAAKVLSTYDKSYDKYALDVAKDATVPPNVFNGVVQGYLDHQQAQESLDANRVKQLRDVVGSYEAARPEANLESLKSRLGAK